MSEDQPQPQENQKSASRIFMEELTAGPPSRLPFWRRAGQSLLIPVLAIITGLILGGILIVLTTEDVYTA